MTSPAQTLIKICGNTTVADVQLAARLGADYVGIIVEHAPSPRNIDLEQAAEIRRAVDIRLVAVTVNLPLARLLHIHDELRPAALQLHGDETPELVSQLKSHKITVWAVATGAADHVPQRAHVLNEAGADAILIDARHIASSGTIYGGTGQLSDWETARELVEGGVRVILAGGLDPHNVGPAVRAVRPWMVDVVSGVEAGKGIKDAGKVQEFIEAARSGTSPPTPLLPG